MADAILDASLLVLLAVATVTDLRERLVPDRAVLAATLVALAVLGATEAAALVERLGWALGAGGFLLAAALLRPDGMGLGDVKLGAGAAAGLAIVARGGWEARTRTIAFAPFLAAGGVAALLAQP
jgi:Flp pilus assembly protein protease CpaA